MDLKSKAIILGRHLFAARYFFNFHLFSARSKFILQKQKKNKKKQIKAKTKTKERLKTKCENLE